jgi:hypothetical protein
MNQFWTFDRTPWMGDQPDSRPLPIQDNATYKNADTSIPRAGFEPTILVFMRPKTVRATDGAATGTGTQNFIQHCSLMVTPHTKTKLLGVISADFEVTKLLIRTSGFIIYWGKLRVEWDRREVL